MSDVHYKNVAYKKDFPIFRDNNLAYLDNAATSQKPQVVIDSLVDFYTTSNANVHRGLYDLSEKATEAYEAARVTTQQFIHATAPEEIIFTSGTTASLNLLATSLSALQLQPGDSILLSPTEHHSNIVPWQLAAQGHNATIEWFDLNIDGTINEATIASKITERVKIVSVAHIANSSGTINPIEKIISIAHAKGIPVIIDGAQSVPHLVTDVQKLDCDFLVFSSHKMCGPTGVGVLYGKRDWLERMSPWQGGGDMIKEVHRDYSTWAELPNKFEAGTPNIAGVVGLAEAIRYLEGIGMKSIRTTCDNLYTYLLDQLATLDFVHIYGTKDRLQRNSIVSFGVAGVHPHDVADILNREQVAIRAGHHCAQLLMAAWQVPATCRASVYFYNEPSDIDKLIVGLKKVYETFTK